MNLIKKVVQLLFLSLSILLQTFSQDSQIADIINQVSLDSLVKHVRILSGEDSLHLADTTVLIKNRSFGNPGNDFAAIYLKNKLMKYGADPKIEEFREDGQNIIGMKKGNLYPDEYYIICAHYDGVVDYGADDNVSSCAAILETARILEPYQFDRSIVYALWDEEEIGLYGSEDYASKAAADSMNIAAVINTDMIAYDNDDDHLYDIYLGRVGNTNDLALFIDETAKEYQLELTPNFIVPEYASSDHASFWKYGFTATLFGETFYGDDFNPYWHKTGDRIDKFNMGYFHELSKLTAGLMAKLAKYGLNSVTSVNENQLDKEFKLNQNYPNPFNPSTTIGYSIPKQSHISIKLFDLLGEEMVTLINTWQNAGSYKIDFDASNLSSGIYFYTLKANNIYKTRKMILLK